MTSFEEGGSFLELMAELSLLERLKSHGVERLMSKIQTMLCNSEVTTDAPCTASADSVCWLVDSLDRWNAILYRCGFGLREEKPGSLTCITLDVHKEGEHLVHDEGILEAMCFFYQLFRLHHCVCRLTIGNVDSFRSLWYWFPVLQLSLIVSRELHSLEVVSLPDERGRCRVLEAAAEIATLQELKCTTKFTSKSSLCRMLQPSGPRLTELVLIFGEAELSAGGFFGFLGSCSSLKILRLDGNEIRDIGPLFSLMASNRTIAQLSLKLLNGDMNYIEEGIASVLRRNVVLKQLELSLYDSSASLIAESLEVNTALDSISLEGFCITDMSPFARMLRINRTLRKLNLAHVRSDEDIPALVEAIRSNETLVELCLWGSSTLDRSLVEALRYNSTLEFLHLRQISASSDQGRLMQAALEPWALERLTAVWDGGCCFDLAHALQSGAAMSSLNLLYENNHNSPTFHGLAEVFEALALNQTVKFLSLRMGASNLLPRSVTHKLCLALASNNALESLSLWIKDRKDVATLQLICEGLSQNSHVRTLRITVSGSDPAALQHMATLLGKNKSITSLVFQVQVELVLDFNLSKSLSKDWSAECRVLAEAISRSDYLLEADVKVKDYDCSVNYTPDLTLTVLRNLSSVSRAVRFALTPSTDKQAAATFQKYHRSPVLFHKLKEAKIMSDKEAASLVRSAANFIARHFFIVTAVVKRTLQCERAKTAALQLTDLNEACLLKVVSYLRVCDVQS